MFSAEHLMRIFVSRSGSGRPQRGSHAYRAVQDLFYFNRVILNIEAFASILNIMKYGNTGLVSNVCFIVFILNPLTEPHLLYCDDKLLSHWLLQCGLGDAVLLDNLAFVGERVTGRAEVIMFQQHLS